MRLGRGEEGGESRECTGAHIDARKRLDLPFSMPIHPFSPAHTCRPPLFRPPCPLLLCPPAALFPPERPPFPSAPYCQEIFVTESRVVSLGEQATPKVSRLSGPAAPSIRATIIGQLKPGESVRVTCHPIIIRCPRGGSTTYPRDRAWVAVTTNSGNTVARGGGVRARERAKGSGREARGRDWSRAWLEEEGKARGKEGSRIAKREERLRRGGPKGERERKGGRGREGG